MHNRNADQFTAWHGTNLPPAKLFVNCFGLWSNALFEKNKIQYKQANISTRGHIADPVHDVTEETEKSVKEGSSGGNFAVLAKGKCEHREQGRS